MKNILLILSVGLAFFAKADYIYWMVDTPAKLKDFSDSVDSNFQWNKAILSVQNEQITVSGISSDGTGGRGYLGSLTYTDAQSYNDVGAYAYASLAGKTGDYFLIELFDDSGNWKGSYSDTRSNLAQYIFGDNTMSIMPASGFGSGSGATYSVPEPTSGLLFLVGGVLLGLKRRREVV